MNEFQKWIGVGERHHPQKSHETKVTDIIRETGRGRGKRGGVTVEHRDGRIDAIASPEPVHVTKSRSTGEIVSVE
jgi:hypothetical protein